MNDASTAFRGNLPSDKNLGSSVRSYNDLFSRSLQCLSENGNTLNFTELSPVIVLNVTINFQSGGKMTKMIDLKKIGKSFEQRKQLCINVC